MKAGPRIALGAAGILVAALAWGFWQAQTNASVSLRVDDYGLKSDKLVYASPHDVTLTLLGPANEPLAVARSVEPETYILAVHPDKEIGNCQHRARSDYADCYAAYAAWQAKWAPLVRRANVVVGKCQLRDLPVGIRISNDAWLLWWVPLPHVGGTPRRDFEFSVKVNSRTCASAG